MEESFQFKLINGMFSADEAAKVLFPLLQHKINFHAVEKFSSEIRNDEDAFNSNKRIAELQEVQTQVVKVLEQIKQNNQKIQLTGEITIHAI